MSTRTCPHCGAQVQDTDDFCGNCGNYLGWGVKAAEDSGFAGPAPVGEVPAADPVGEVSVDRASAAGLVVPVEQVPFADSADQALVADPAQLGPVLPGRPEARRPLPTLAGGVTVEGPACPVCGTTNPPERRFCRRCATPLHPVEKAAVVAKRRRWRWRGDRSRWLRRLAALLVVVALVIAGFLFWPQATALWEDLRDRLATPAPVTPASTTASASVPDHPPAAAVDGLSNRYWGAPAVGDSIDFTFAEPFRLLTVVIHAGASAEEEGFVAEARPTALDMVVTTAGGTTETVPITLADQPGEQRTDTGISDVVRIRLVVRGAAGLVPGKHIALGEVEFFRRS